MPVSSVTASLTYTPPLGTSPCTVSFGTQENYVPSSVGTLDVPIGTAAQTAIPIPFGTVTVADFLVVRNRSNQDMGLRLNGIPAATAVLYQIPPNGQVVIAFPTPPGGSPLTSAHVDTTVMQAGVVGLIDYWVLGAT
jgi:hypothetical protein